MSRTYNTRPYWVRQNQDAKFYDHDHTQLGKTYRVWHYVRDENGKLVRNTKPVYETAEVAVDLPWWAFRGFSLAEIEKTKRRARILVLANRGQEAMCTGYRETYESFYTEHQIPDHCTEGEPVKRRDRRWRDVPCTPDLGYKGYYTRYGDSGARQHYLDLLHSQDRVRTRDTLRNMTKAANSWEDGWEDDFEEVERLTDPYKDGLSWLLW